MVSLKSSHSHTLSSQFPGQEPGTSPKIIIEDLGQNNFRQ